MEPALTSIKIFIKSGGVPRWLKIICMIHWRNLCTDDQKMETRNSQLFLSHVFPLGMQMCPQTPYNTKSQRYIIFKEQRIIHNNFGSRIPDALLS